MHGIDELRSALRYVPATGNFFWTAKRHNRHPVGMMAGTLQKSGYVVIGYGRKYYKAHRLAWLFTFGMWPERSLDHINHNPSDNRIENLRLCTSSQNQANRAGNKNNSTGYRGVTFHKRIGKFQASIRVNWKPIHLGTFESAAEASLAYERAAFHYFGEFAAILNSADCNAGASA